MKYSKNKATLINTLITIGVLIFIILCVWGSKVMDPKVILGVVAFFEVFVCMPIFNIYFYKLFDTPMGWKKFANFIPLYNYTISINPVTSVISLISMAAFLLSIILMFFPSTYVWLFSETTIYGLSDKIPVIVFILFTVLNLVSGIGLLLCKKDIDFYFSKGTGQEIGSSTTFLGKLLYFIPWLSVVLLCLPILRVVPLTMCIDKLTVLGNLNLNISNININEEE